MGTPSKAQIEAALSAVKFCLINGTQPFRVDLQILCDALTAAQVGEPTYTQRQADSMVRQTWSATIERCAQVAEQMAADLEALPQDQINRVLVDALRQAAAAIRKLKDQS